MKYLLTVIIIFAIGGILHLHSQWQADVRLTNDPFYSSSSYGRSIEAKGDTIHIVWHDNRDGNNEIYYKRSLNSGTTWSSDTRLTNNSSVSQYPSIAVSGDAIHVSWEDNRDGNFEIYYKRSTDAGTTWGADVRLTNANYSSIGSNIAAFSNFVHIVWIDARFLSPYKTFFKTSSDGGLNWSSDFQLSDGSSQYYNVSIAASGNYLHVTWADNLYGNLEIFYRNSTDAGLNWAAIQRLTNDGAASLRPKISVSGNLVGVVWYDSRDGNDEIYFKRSANNGVNWDADTRLTNEPAESHFPSVSIQGNIVQTVWVESRDGNTEIYNKLSTNGGQSWTSDYRLTNDTAISTSPSVISSGNYVHTVWSDGRDANREIYYKRNPTGNVVGIQNSGSGLPAKFYLNQNYPNPFNPSTTIRFNLSQTGYTSLKIFDVTGREVAELISGEMNAGQHSIVFNAENLSSGIYYYRVQSAGNVAVKKMLMIK
jgi:hypothetical protein